MCRTQEVPPFRTGLPARIVAGMKIVLITGASSGIGEATARRLAADGHHVVLGARRVDRLRTLVDELNAAGGSAEADELDVTSLDSVRAFVEAAHARHGRVDVLVNNAGVMPLSTLESLRIDEWNQMIDVNLRGVLHGIAAVLPLMREARPHRQRRLDVGTPGRPDRRGLQRDQARRPGAQRRAAPGEPRRSG